MDDRWKGKKAVLQQKIYVIWRIVLILNMVIFIKMSSGLISWYFKMPNALYANPLVFI